MSVEQKACRQAAGMTDDINGGQPGDWLAIGWFTPDYRPLAEKFAANLSEHAAPFHLFHRPKVATGWNTAQKPDVVLHAMSMYPDTTLVLMDLDCVVHGDISPVVDVPDHRDRPQHPRPC